MSIPIFQLAYLSTRRDGVTDLEIVDNIVLPAITKNRALGVTGCLWFDHDHFFQVLEGAREAIEALFGVISKDDRHGAVTLLLTEETGQRRFERFGMRAIDCDATRSLPTLIRAYRESVEAKVRPSRARSGWLAGWIPRPPRSAPERTVASAPAATSRSLVRMVVDELAGWSDATPA